MDVIETLVDHLRCSDRRCCDPKGLSNGADSVHCPSGAPTHRLSVWRNPDGKAGASCWQCGLNGAQGALGALWLRDVVGNGDLNESSESSTLRLGGSEEVGLKIIPSTIIPPPDKTIDSGLLGPYLPHPAALVFLSGETSAGKTVLLYNIAHCLAKGAPFAGLAPPRPMRVLYVDLESPENVHRSLLDAIGRAPKWVFVRNLPHPLGDAKGSLKGLEELEEAIQSIMADIVIIDPLSVAWPCRDENDNAEAARQMWALKQLAVNTGTVIVAVWNMGEGKVKEKFRARGATARLDRADLGMNYTGAAGTIRLLKIVKSRQGTLGKGLTLKFSGDFGFEAADVQIAVSPTRLAQQQQDIVNFMNEKRSAGQFVVRRKEMVEALGGEDLLDKALHKLNIAGELERVMQGLYRLPSTSEPPNIERSEVLNADVDSSEPEAQEDDEQDGER